MMEQTQVTDKNDFLNTPLKMLENKFFDRLREQGKSANTLKNYRTDLECFNQYLLQNQKSLDISKYALEEIQEYGKYITNRYSSDNSRRRRIQALRIFFDFLVTEQVVPGNPVRKLPTSPKFLDIPRPASFADVKTLWSHLIEESNNPHKMSQLLARRNQVIALLIFGGGLKVSDISRLKLDHITLGEDMTRVMIVPLKRDPYTVELPKVFAAVYKNYLALLTSMKDESGLVFDDVLFNANPHRILSGGLSARGLEIIFEELRKKLMLEMTPKSLRQACIFKWLHFGKADNLIKEWMGVAPSYSMKLYKSHMHKHIYNDDFLEEMYLNYKSTGQAIQ